MKGNKKINVKGSEIAVSRSGKQDYISLTDIAKYKTDDTSAVIANWMRNRNTIEFLGLWETLYNPDFKPLEFEGFRNIYKRRHETKRPFKKTQSNCHWANEDTASGKYRKYAVRQKREKG